MGIIEGVQAFIEPVNKLIDLTAKAIGVLYEPRQIREKSKAEVLRIELLSQAMEKSNVPVIISNGEISLDSSNFDEIYNRTSKRLAFQELLKQKNIESVLDAACDELQDEPPVSTRPVDLSWMSRLFDSVGDISNEYLQSIWAKLLAGEIKKPGTFSLRTMEKLNNLSQADAQLFQEMTKYFFVGRSGNGAFLYNNEKVLDMYKIEYTQIMLLAECGLILEQPFVTRQVPFTGTANTFVFRADDYICTIFSETDCDGVINIPVYSLTSSGNELFSIIKSPADKRFVHDVIEVLPDDIKLFPGLNNKSVKFSVSYGEDNYTYESNTTEMKSEEDKYANPSHIDTTPIIFTTRKSYSLYRMLHTFMEDNVNNHNDNLLQQWINDMTFTSQSQTIKSGESAYICQARDLLNVQTLLGSLSEKESDNLRLCANCKLELKRTTKPLFSYGDERYKQKEQEIVRKTKRGKRKNGRRKR